MNQIPEQRSATPEEYIGAFRLAKQACYWARTNDEAYRTVDSGDHVQERLSAIYPQIHPQDRLWLGHLASEAVIDMMNTAELT